MLTGVSDKSLFAALSGLVFAVLLTGCETAEEVVSSNVAAAPLAVSEWRIIEPEGEALCSNGTPYRFHVRSGDPSKVMFFLNGGGACWNGQLCDISNEIAPYTPFAEMDGNSPEGGGGILDASNLENPFQGWTQIFLPYCTGDAHLGMKDAVYTRTSGETLTIYHRGKANVQSAMDWVFKNHAEPERIFVTGASAGAIASPFYAGMIADHYPTTNVIQLGDGAGGYRSPVVAEIFAAWGVFEYAPDWPELTAIDQSKASMEDFFRVTGVRHPGLQLAQFNNVDDGVQQQFLALMGEEAPVRDLMQANLDELAETLPGLRVFSAPGSGHTALRDDVFYTTVTGGVRLVDWVRDLAEGRPVQNVACAETGECD